MAHEGTARADVAAPRAVAAPDGGARLDRWFGWVDTLAFLGLVNLLVLAGTLAGGVVLGVAPALAAATVVSRTRLRGDTQRTARVFLRTWTSSFGRANLLAAPGLLALALTGTSLLVLDGAPAVLRVALAVVAGLAVVHVLLALTMDAHYDLRGRDVPRLAWAFLLRFPGAPLLLAATTALVGVVTALVPGLLPVVSIGAWAYLCTALCLSFYAANDRHLGDRPAETDPLDE
ncbi:YesL family protein [Isoptericola sp. NPDC019693]|uniref:YesL family protein n=1 Tax=Isoptericola sp. NPDC019693 TaxID=3364009 RepID=UPI00378A2FFA